MGSISTTKIWRTMEQLKAKKQHSPNWILPWWKSKRNQKIAIPVSIGQLNENKAVGKQAEIQ